MSAIGVYDLMCKETVPVRQAPYRSDSTEESTNVSMTECVRRLFLSNQYHYHSIIVYRGIRKCLTEGCMAECIRGLFLSCKHHQLISVSNYMYISATGQMLFKIGRLMEKFQNLCTGQLCKDGTCIPKDETCSKYHFPTILATLIFVYQFYYQTMSY